MVLRLAVVLLFSFCTYAQSTRSYAVFDVRKSLPLTDREPVSRDYYVNLGSDQGAKVGSVLSVKRRLPVIDVYRNQAQGDLVVEIAKLKVIHSQSTMSVGRVISFANRKDIPVVPYESVMMGDQVELTAENTQELEAKREQASVKPRTPKKKPVQHVQVTVEKAAPVALAPKPTVVNTNPEAATGAVAKGPENSPKQ